MPQACGVRGCVNSVCNRSKYRRHTVPRKEPARSTWLRLIQRDDVPSNAAIVVCFLHFRPVDYELNVSLVEGSGVGKFKHRLRPEVTPSLNLPNAAAAQENVVRMSPVTCLQRYILEIYVSCTCLAHFINFNHFPQIQAEQCVPEGDSLNGDSACASLVSHASSFGNEESGYSSHTQPASPVLTSQSPSPDMTPTTVLQCMNCGCRQPNSVPLTEEKGTQYSLPRESKWTQTTVVQTRRVGTQANHNAKSLQTSSTQTSEDFCEPGPQHSGIQWEPKRCSTPVMNDVTETTIGDTDNPADTTYVPQHDSLLGSCSDSPQASSVSPQEERKYIIFESKLKELFRSCTTCLNPCTTSFSCVGSLLRVESCCVDGHTFVWESQPYISNKPAGNVLLSAAILFSGASPTPTLRMLKLINVKIFCDHTFFNYQRGYLLPAITEVWTQHQAALLVELQGKETDLAADGRCDSPGHNAKYLSYSFYDGKLNKVVHTVQVQSNEVASSYHMELEALQRGLEELHDFNVGVRSLTTDRHPSVRKYMRTSHPEVNHQFDVWHVSKGIRKKLMSASKEKVAKHLSYGQSLW
ncbi:uncharacterized protein LOC135370836 isoform X1 [Ornithodoros turicata]|uniref:uncharacterized protein LOC135370836 isoform X1 n=1 Tax=Ornithodoros turicata TaxID=34597 RepID=UPI003139504F